MHNFTSIFLTTTKTSNPSNITIMSPKEAISKIIEQDKLPDTARKQMITKKCKNSHAEAMRRAERVLEMLR